MRFMKHSGLGAPASIGKEIVLQMAIRINTGMIAASAFVVEMIIKILCS
jgi:hypothetical protein